VFRNAPAKPRVRIIVSDTRNRPSLSVGPNFFGSPRPQINKLFDPYRLDPLALQPAAGAVLLLRPGGIACHIPNHRYLKNNSPPSPTMPSTWRANLPSPLPLSAPSAIPLPAQTHRNSSPFPPRASPAFPIPPQSIGLKQLTTRAEIPHDPPACVTLPSVARRDARDSVARSAPL